MSNRHLRAACIVLGTCSVGAKAECILVPPPGNALSVDGFYRDRRGSVVDPKRRDARDQAVAVYESTIRQVQAQADAYVLRGEKEAGTCALRQLDAWAKAGTLTGRLETRQANYERNWYLAGFALAYLKLHGLEGAEEKNRIEGWLGDMAAASAGAIDSGEVPGNNLLYWAGLALGAAGLATKSSKLEERGQAILQDGLNAISPDGMLGMEARRGAKALDYHAFAAAPLVLLAFIADARGRGFDKAALIRLVDAILSGLRSPERFAAAAGALQVMPAEWNLAWLPVYRALVPGEILAAHATSSHFLGGDVFATMAAIRYAASR